MRSPSHAPVAGDPGPELPREMLELRTPSLPAPGTRLRQILDYVAECGERGATDEEMRDALLLGDGQQRYPRVQLAFRCLLQDSGSRRLTRRGRQATVWITTDAVPPP